MVVEFFRVISAVMADVAQAMTNALPNVLEDDADQEEGDETVTVQLSSQKARKLQKASEVRDMAEVLGTAFDKVSRSLMASLERLDGAESRRCAQSLLNKLVAKFGRTCPSDMPDEAEGLLSGFVTFGAEVQGDAGSLTSMDDYFVSHWWSIVEPTLTGGRDEIFAASGGRELKGVRGHALLLVSSTAVRGKRQTRGLIVRGRMSLEH